jgi:copper chaperone
MRKSRNLILPFLIPAFCLMLVAPVYAGDSCASKTKAKQGCTSTTNTDATAKASGCTKPCSKPCVKTCTSKAASADVGSARKLTFGVAYMTCNGCANSVKKAIQLVDGVQSVAVDYRSGVADVEFDYASASAADIIKAVEKAGFNAQVGPYSEKEMAEFASSAGKSM